MPLNSAAPPDGERDHRDGHGRCRLAHMLQTVATMTVGLPSLLRKDHPSQPCNTGSCLNT